jgi:hypothetical protein
MWVIGIIVFALFYRFAIGWYWKLWTLGNPLQRPFLWRSGWYHFGVLAISGSLLIVSAYFFSLTSSWLAILPVPLVVMSLIWDGIMRGNRRYSIISKAVEIQIRLEEKGEPQSEINRAISLATTGDDFTLDEDLKTFLKFGVLSHEGLLNGDLQTPDRWLAEIRDIDHLIDRLYNGRKNSRERFSARS